MRGRRTGLGLRSRVQKVADLGGRQARISCRDLQCGGCCKLYKVLRGGAGDAVAAKEQS